MLEVNVLVLEDQAEQVAKIRQLIQSSDALATYKIVQVASIADFLNILDSRLFDLVLADYKIIAHHVSLCLEVVQRIGIPLICLSSVSGEEIAVEMMRQGVFDYILKKRLDLLPSAIKRGLDTRLATRANTKEYSLAMITFRLHQSLDLEDLLNTAVSEVQHWLHADRVLFYLHGTELGGRVVAETTTQPEWSLLGKTVPGMACEYEWLERYHRGHAHVIEDVYTAPLAAHYMRMLLDVQVRASLTIAIVQKGEIWGFLGVHSCTLPRRWQPGELELLEQLSTQIAIAIHQFSLMERSLVEAQGKKDAEAKAAHLARYDGLTGLSNRSSFIEIINYNLEKRIFPFVILLTDIDRFKVINDRFGYAVGDQVLATIAQRLRSVVTPPDTVARLGGDKFAILQTGAQKVANIQVFAQQLMAEIAQPMIVEEEPVSLSVSIGITVSTPTIDKVDELFRDAEIALQSAKNSGRGQYVFFESIMREQFVLRMQLTEDLQQAVDRGELYLLYQPIHSLSLRKITGLEALLRWQHPRRGAIHPGEFITLAEEAGLIIPIGNWVIQQVCRQLRLWQERFPDLTLSTSVNVSALQLEDASIVETIAAVLAETQLPPGSLKLEITESVLMKDLDSMRARLEKIRSMGVEISIDDFGTGYSSFSYLQSLPVSVLKIDQSFIGQLDTNSNTNQIVEAIVTLAHKLGLEVVAEGVETTEQLNCFSAMSKKRSHVQGFLISRPLTCQGVEELLAKQG